MRDLLGSIDLYLSAQPLLAWLVMLASGALLLWLVDAVGRATTAPGVAPPAATTVAAAVSFAPLVVTHANAHAVCPTTTNLLDSQLDAIGQSDGMIGGLFDVLNTRPDGQYVRETTLDALVRHIRSHRSAHRRRARSAGVRFRGPHHAVRSRGCRETAADARVSRQVRRPDQLVAIAQDNWLRMLRVTWRGTGADA